MSIELLIIAITAPCSAAVSYFIARWRMSNQHSSSLGKIQGELKGLGKTFEARCASTEKIIETSMKGYDIRLDSFGERFGRLEERIDKVVDARRQ